MSAALFSDDMTLREAKDALRVLVDEGHDCPTCTQFAKVYRRKITGRQAAVLIALYRACGRDFGHAPTVAGKGYEAAMVSLLRYWGLIEEMPERREDGGRAGWWRVTALGELFVRGEQSVPKYARIYNGRCLGLTGEPVYVQDALGKHFDYHELMAGV